MSICPLLTAHSHLLTAASKACVLHPIMTPVGSQRLVFVADRDAVIDGTLAAMATLKQPPAYGAYLALSASGTYCWRACPVCSEKRTYAHNNG